MLLSGTKSCLTLCDTMDCSTPGFSVLHYLPEFAQTHVPLSQWCHPTISSSVAPFSSCPQSFQRQGLFQWVCSSHQVANIGTSASTSVLPVNIQGWFPLQLTGLISLLSKGLWRVFSNTTVQKHQFFGTQPSLWFNSHVRTWLGKNHSFDYMDLCWQSDVSAF